MYSSKPNKLDKYTKIPNEIMNTLMRTNFSAYQIRVLWVIWRKTYGWNKASDYISNSQLVSMTGIRKQHISRAVKELVIRNIVTKSGYKIAFNENYSQWRELPKQVTVTNSGNEVTSTGEHKRNYNKKNYNKRNNKANFDSEILELSNLLANKILFNNPKHRLLSNEKKEDTILRWADAVDKLHRIDKQTIEDIQIVIEWCQNDPFWKQNILSGDKLREKWDQLYPKAKAAKKKYSWMEK